MCKFKGKLKTCHHFYSALGSHTKSAAYNSGGLAKREEMCRSSTLQLSWQIRYTSNGSSLILPATLSIFHHRIQRKAGAGSSLR